jgi:hypothetical protein
MGVGVAFVLNATAAVGADHAIHRAGGSPALTSSGVDQPPAGVWFATGRVTGVEGTVNVHVGSVLVRGWQFVGVCHGSAPCETQFSRQLSSGQYQETMLAPIAGGQRAAFGGSNVPCVRRTGEAATPAIEFDTYTFRQPAVDGHLSVSEKAIFNSCGGAPASISETWTATLVHPTASPAVNSDPDHASTSSAFVADATRVCSTVNTALAPIATAIKHEGGASTPAAAASLAKLYPKIVPLLLRNYTALPQPPGALDRLWTTSYAELTRVHLSAVASQVTAVTHALVALGQFLHTGNGVAEQTELADLFVAGTDGPPVQSSTQDLLAEARVLGLPTICVVPPAFPTL